jgi:hypothetical protein
VAAVRPEESMFAHHVLGHLVQALYGTTVSYAVALCAGITLPFWLGRGRVRQRADWWLRLVLTCAIVLPPLWLMIWNDSSIWLRLFISGLFLAGAIRGFLKSRGLKPLAGNNRSPWVMIVLCALFAPLAAVDAVEIGKAYLYPRPVLALSFPFRGGVFVAARGGNGTTW